MRDRFSELISQGVASFKYTNISKDIPEQDYVCRTYNNVFSIPSDTHMSCLEDGTRVITGHIINTDKWDSFLYGYCCGAVNFKTSGYWCLSDFLYKNCLRGRKSTLNGDVVYLLEPYDPMEEKNVKVLDPVVTTTESKIPMQITTLTNTGNKMHITECMKDTIKETIDALNESSYVKGSNWVPTENGFTCLIGDKVYLVEAKLYHRYSLETKERDGEISLLVWDCYYDTYWSACINDIGKVTYYSETLRKDFSPVYNFLDKMNECIKGFDWQEDLKCPMGYTIEMSGPWDDKNWKLTEYPGYEIFMGVTSIGQLKKKR